MLLNKIKISFLYVLLALQGCASDNLDNKYNKVKSLKFISDNIEYRDSLFITYTIKEWGKNKWRDWAIRDDVYKIDLDHVELFFGGTFYSSDKLKAIFWVGQKMPNANTYESYNENDKLNRVCPDGGDTVYHMGVLIGARDNANKPWKVYPFDEISAECFPSKNAVKENIKEYFLDKMSTDAVYVRKDFLDKDYGGKVRNDLEEQMIDLGYGDKNSPYILKEYGYNLYDNGFWSKSLIWQKGAYIPDYYLFQGSGKDTLNIPVINYPNEILKLYK